MSDMFREPLTPRHHALAALESARQDDRLNPLLALALTVLLSGMLWAAILYPLVGFLP